MKTTHTIEERFWSKCNKTDTCWLWLGGVDRDGYGYHYIHSIQYKAHRLAWKLTFGDIPRDLCVLHKCDTPGCINPTHLYLGTRLDNARDRHNRGHSLVGVKHPNSRLSTEERLNIYNDYISGVGGNVRLGRKYGVSGHTILKVVDQESLKKEISLA